MREPTEPMNGRPGAPPRRARAWALVVAASLLGWACLPPESPPTARPSDAERGPSVSPPARPRVDAGLEARTSTGAPVDAGAPWTFAVLSDLHVRPSGAVPENLPHVIAAVIATRPRFVVILGDSTYGQRSDPISLQPKAFAWWRVVRRQLARLREAGIPVFPLAGNHDSDLHIYRKAYAHAWRDIDRWAAPLPIRGRKQPVPRLAVDAVPFTYSTEVDGVHLTFAHVVTEKIAPGVTDFIAAELARAKDAPLRLLFAHVPLVAMGDEPRKEFPGDFARLIEASGVDVYVTGHEHLVWDEDVPLPGGSLLRQVVVGTASGLWRFGPNAAARKRAGCVRRGDRMRCRMPRGGTAFELVLEDGRWLQAQPHTFTLLTVDGDTVTARALAVDAGGAVSPFGLDEGAAAEGASP